MVTIQAATAYLRMTRKDTSDVNPIISMFGHIGFSVGEGFLACLGTDLMVPPKSDQDKLITYISGILVILYLWDMLIQDLD